MDTSIGTVSIEIESKSQSASSGIKELTTNLLNLRNATSGSYKNLSRLSSYLDQLKTSSAGLKAVNSNFSNLSGLMTGLKSFGYLPKGKELGSLLNKIKKIPEVFKNLSDADIEKFTKKINDLTIALTPLATQMEKVSAGFMAFPSKIEKVANGVARSSKKTTSIFSFLSHGITGFYAKTSLFVAGLSQITNVIRGFVEQSSNYNEALNLFTVSMGQYVNEAEDFVDNFSSALYLDPVNVMTYMGTFQSLIEGLGVGSKNAYAMSTAMTQLTYDLSSFRNIDFETSFLKIQSGLSGELEPLRNVGIALDMATLQQLAYSLGIEKTINEMTQAEKVELRYLQIMKSTTKMQGDMGRTLLQPANALRVLQQQFTLLARAIGNIFIPILMRVLPYIMVVTEMLTAMANKLANFLGFEIQDVDYSSLQNGSSYFEDLADSADSAGDAIKGVLAPFDELNIVSKSSSTGSLGATSGAGEGLGLDLPTYDALMGAVTRNLDTVRENVEKFLDVAKNVAIVVGSIWAVGKILKFADTLGDTLKLFKTGEVLSGSFSTTLKNLGTNFSKGYSTNKKFTDGLKNMLSPMQKIVIGITGLAIGTATAYESMKNLGNGTKDLIPQLGKTTASIGGATASGALLGSVIPGVGTAIGALGGFIVGTTGALFGMNSGMKELAIQMAKKDLFGNITVSVTEWTGVLDNLSTKIFDNSSRFENFSTTMEDLNTTFTSSADSLDLFGYKFGVLGQKITDEDSINITNAIQTMMDSANSIIDNGTSYSLSLWTNAFMGMTKMTAQEQANILDIITQNGAYQKTELGDAQTRITETYANGISARGYLTDQERIYIAEQLQKIRELTSTEMTKTQADTEYYKNLFAEKNLILDEQSYANYKTSLDAYNKEKLKLIKDNYTQEYTDAEAQKNLLKKQMEKATPEKKADLQKQIDDLNKVQATAYTTRLEAEKTLKKDIEDINDKITASLKTKYNSLTGDLSDTAKNQRNILEGIFKDLKIDSKDLSNSCSAAGATAGKSFVDGFNSGKIALKDSAFSKSISGTTNFGLSWKGYADGGFPDKASMFMANENGIPEMIGRIGNQTAVANNDQITTAVAQAVYAATVRANKETQSQNTTIVNLGNKTLYSDMGKRISRTNDRYGTNVVTI